VHRCVALTFTFYQRVLEGVTSVPGVLEAGYSEFLPLESWRVLMVVKKKVYGALTLMILI